MLEVPNIHLFIVIVWPVTNSMWFVCATQDTLCDLWSLLGIGIMQRSHLSLSFVKTCSSQAIFLIEFNFHGKHGLFNGIEKTTYQK